jgi:DNA ligase IV
VQNLVLASDDGFPSWDVLHSSWLLGAANGERPLKPEPSDFLLLSKKSHKRLKGAYDTYGDSFTEHATKESLQNCLSKMTTGSTCERHELDELEDQLLAGSNLRSIFRPCIAYFDQLNEASIALRYNKIIKSEALEFSNLI